MWQFKLYTFGLINSTYRENGNKCLLTIAKEPASVFSSRVGMGLQKNGPFTQAINEQYLYKYSFHVLL